MHRQITLELNMSNHEICTGAGPARVADVNELTSTAVFCAVSAANASPASPDGIVDITFPLLTVAG